MTRFVAPAAPGTRFVPPAATIDTDRSIPPAVRFAPPAEPQQLSLFGGPEPAPVPSRFAAPAPTAPGPAPAGSPPAHQWAARRSGPTPTGEQAAIIDAYWTGQHLVVSAGAGSGKALRRDQPVLTPRGWRPIGSLSAGDTVYGSAGQPVTVIGVFPQGVRPLFEVVVSDGTVIVADADHLWSTTTTKDRDRKRPAKVRTTAEIAATVRLRGGRINHYLPMLSGPVVMPRADLPLDPYLVGVLLGDAGLTGKAVILSTPDPEILAMVRLALPDGVNAVPVPGSVCDYRLSVIGLGFRNPLIAALRELGLMGCDSSTKHIPDDYLYGSVEQRGALLRGLLDTDGSAAGCAAEYSTASKTLATQVTWLVQSLGGYTTMTERSPWFTYRGERRAGRTSYRLRVNLPATVPPFRLPRKANAMLNRTRFTPYRQIIEVRPVATGDAVCIAVDAPDRLYLTAGCVPTHNTTTAVMLAHERPGRAIAYIAYNASVAKDARRRFPAWVDTRTAHSLAFRAVGHLYAHRLPDQPGRQRAGTAQARRLPAAEVAKVLRLRGERFGDRYLSGAALARYADATVAAYCRSADDDLSARHAPTLAGLDGGSAADLAALILPAARRLWDDLRDPAGTLWFDHGAYLKIWALTRPRLPADVVVLDEAQDANPVIAAIVAGQDHAQLVAIGDESQAIYGWNGAIDAMSSMDGTHLSLTESWRFGPAVADEANAWLDLLGAELRLTGRGGASRLDAVTVPDAVLCRSNGGAIGAVMDMQGAGRRVAMVGGGRDLRRYCYAAISLMKGKGCDLPEFAAFRTWHELLDYVAEGGSGADLALWVKLINRYGPSTLIDVINGLSTEDRADVVVSTAHKAKGLEWPTVQVSGDFAPPERGDRPDPAELMLAYVTVTRARAVLDVGSLDWRTRGRLDRSGRWMRATGEDYS